MVRTKFKLYLRKLPKGLGGYKWEVFGGTSGGKFHSSIHKTKRAAIKHKTSLTNYAKKHPKFISFRKL